MASGSIRRWRSVPPRVENICKIDAESIKDQAHDQDQVDPARSKLATARAELRRQEASLARLRKEVPLQIEVAKRSLAAAKADQARAEESLELTRDEVDRSIDQARAAQKSA